MEARRVKSGGNGRGQDGVEVVRVVSVVSRGPTFAAVCVLASRTSHRSPIDINWSVAGASIAHSVLTGNLLKFNQQWFV